MSAAAGGVSRRVRVDRLGDYVYLDNDGSHDTRYHCHLSNPCALSNWPIYAMVVLFLLFCLLTSR